MGQLAEQLRSRGQRTEARKLAEEVLAKDKMHPLASAVKARLLLLAGDTEPAKTLLKAALEAHPTDPRLLLEINSVVALG